MSKFPIVREAEEKSEQETFFVDYSITAKGWNARGSIKHDPKQELTFWSLLQMVVESVMAGDRNPGILNESYTDGFSRYLAPVEDK